MKVKKRIVSLLLSIFIVILWMPFTAMAQEGSEFVDSGSGLKFLVLTVDAGAETGTVQLIQDSYSETAYIIPDTVSDNGITYTVSSIGYGAFAGNTGLISVTLPSHLTEIGNNAFSGCTGLTDIILPDSITVIGISAFAGSGLTSIAIPGSVETIYDYAFNGCSNLEEFIFLGITPPQINGHVFTGTGLSTVIVPAGTVAQYDISIGWKLPESIAITGAAASITEVKVNPAEIELERGSTMTFSATVSGSGSFSPAVEWSVESEFGSRIDPDHDDPNDGILKVAAGEQAQILTVKAVSVADSEVFGEAVVTVKASAPQEQFSLPVGSICYFDLSAFDVNASSAVVNSALPDTSLKWVPFLYAGTVNAYSLNAGAEGITSAAIIAAENAGRRSLFVADHVVYKNITWDELNAAGMIFGNDYTANGVSYRLRSPSGGSSASTPLENEWDQLLIKGDYLHNYNCISWAQDTFSGGASLRVIRGYNSAAYWSCAPSSYRYKDFSYRPVLEVLDADNLPTGALKTVAFDMNGNGTLGSESLDSAAVVYSGGLILPEINETNGFHYTGAPQEGMLLGWNTGSAFYAAGTEISSLLDGVVLTAAYGIPVQNSLPTRKTGVPAEVTAVVKVNTPYTLTLGEIFEDADSDALTYRVAVNGADETIAAADYAYTPTAIGQITLVFRADDGSAISNDTYTVKLTADPVPDVEEPGNGEEEPGNSGGGGSHGGGTSSTSSYSADARMNNLPGLKFPVTVDKAGRSAVVSLNTQSGNIAEGGSLEIKMPAISDVNRYSVKFPSDSISSSKGAGTMTIITEAGSISLSSNMLTKDQAAGSKAAGITIGKADKSGLPSQVKDAIGDRPLIQLELSIDGKLTQWNNPNAPVTVSIPYTPTSEEKENPESIVIWYIDGSGNTVCMQDGRYNAETGTVTFTTTHFSNYAVVFNPVNFTDVAPAAWYNKAAAFIAARGITVGTGGGKYSPNAKVTRGELLVMIMKAYGISPDSEQADNFSDAENTYYTGYLAAAKRLGISSGIGGNRYDPNAEITRQEMFTLLYNALTSMGKVPEIHSTKMLTEFSDAGQIADWAQEPMQKLTQSGVISGNNGMVTPGDTTTRAEMAQVLYSLLTY